MATSLLPRRPPLKERKAELLRGLGLRGGLGLESTSKPRLFGSKQNRGGTGGMPPSNVGARLLLGGPKGALTLGPSKAKHTNSSKTQSNEISNPSNPKKSWVLGLERLNRFSPPVGLLLGK